MGMTTSDKLNRHVFVEYGGGVKTHPGPEGLVRDKHDMGDGHILLFANQPNFDR